MTKKIVLTGGPASGKTTMLSILKEEYGTDIEVAKEAATLVYSGGFPRNDTSKRYTYHAQRIIYTCTRELEDLATEINPSAKLILCDRGSLDGAVYWPYGEEDFLKVMGTDIKTECDRYYAIIHMSPPSDPKYYQNTAVRIETLERALEVDREILKIWESHPRRVIIPAYDDFVEKALLVRKTIKQIIDGEI